MTNTNFMQSVIDKFKESTIALVVALPAFFSIMVARLFAFFSEKESLDCIGADTAFVVFVVCYLLLPVVLLVSLHYHYKKNSRDYLPRSIISLLFLISIIAVIGGISYKIYSILTPNAKIKQAFDNSITMNKLNDKLTDFVKLDDLLQLQACLLNLKNQKILTKDDSSLLEYKKAVEKIGKESDHIFCHYQNIATGSFKCNYSNFCIKRVIKNLFLNNFCCCIINPCFSKYFKPFNQTELDKAKEIINYNPVFIDSFYVDKTPEQHRFLLKIKELSYQQAEEQVQGEFASIFKTVQLIGVVMLVLVIFTILFLYWRNLKKSTDLPKGETDLVAQHLIFSAIFAIYLLIPMMQHIEKDKIDVLKPYKSFMLQNWYVPEFIKESVKEAPEPADKFTIIDLKKVEKQLADLKNQLQNTEDSLHDDYRNISNIMPDKNKVDSTNVRVTKNLDSAVSSVSKTVRNKTDSINNNIKNAQSTIDTVKNAIKVK